MPLWQHERHESLRTMRWQEQRARDLIERIVSDTESHAGPWPNHPLDGADPAPRHELYGGACGVIWALHHLQQRGAVKLANALQSAQVLRLLEPNRALMGHSQGAFGAYLMGDTSLRMVAFAIAPDDTQAAAIAHLVEATVDHPARELMWGSPGTMLAALFMQRRTGEARWTSLFRKTAEKLASQLLWSQEEGCHYWDQDLYGQISTYLDGVHGFAATASVLRQGRDLLAPDQARTWEERIAATMGRTAEWEDGLANWRNQLTRPRGGSKLMQYCHGAPGYVICLAGFPGPALDDTLLAAGEAIWQAGPLCKGSNLCHGTGGNGYAFLKLHTRFGGTRWLDRARAFAMHSIVQAEDALAEHGQWRFSLWTGDLGLAIYLLDCIEARDRFPTLDCFFD
ncbi:LanC-like protein [Polaromonas sp.]|uniref:lanthionine synthetase C family protein n=1 Tax=Polaromonas sp. TaxID=1869339 RepID=UPI0025E09205|nr:LanC-like protein [Polaromonas sp.]